MLSLIHRVALGDHDVPEADVWRRFSRSWANLRTAVEQTDEILLYDNTNPDRPHREIAVRWAESWWVARLFPAGLICS